MSFLNSTAKLTNITPIPGNVAKATAIAVLHNHDFFLKTDPHFVKYTTVATPAEVTDAASARKHFELPDGVEPSSSKEGSVVKVYEVVDQVSNPVWSSDVVSTEELVNGSEGLWTRIKSPMGVVMETLWVVRQKKGNKGKGEGGGYELVQEVSVTCNRMLTGFVKGQVAQNFQGIHDKLVKKMVEDAAAGKEHIRSRGSDK